MLRTIFWRQNNNESKEKSPDDFEEDDEESGNQRREDQNLNHLEAKIYIHRDDDKMV